MIRGVVAQLVLCAIILAPIAVRAETPLPRGRSNAVEMLRGELIERGAVFIAGRIVAPPYSVSRRGRAVFINDELVTTGDLLRPADSIDLVRELERVLFLNGAVVVLDNDTRLIGEAPGVVSLLTRFESTTSLEQRIRDAVAFSSGAQEKITISQWSRALQDYETSSDLQTFIRARSRDESESDEEVITHDAGMSMASFAPPLKSGRYALSIVGMLLIAVSCGTLLNERPVSSQRWSETADSDEVIRLVTRALTLVVVLSVFDLVCTLIANASGNFTEVNPLASRLLRTPWLLAAFKVTSTATAVGLLWALRRYVGAQRASWWLCVVLTLVTVRWVTAHSAL